MGCTSCSSKKDGTPNGCQDKGHCSSGGCNKMNTYDWLTVLDLDDPEESKLAEVSFKNGARKTFYRISDFHRFTTGDLVVVDTGYGGYDVGRVSLMGDLVKIQMKRKNFAENRITFEILRKANQRDIERMDEARAIEHTSLVKARVIARNLNLDMKIGDVEFQADMKKATFYYTAEGRVDFRELVRSYAKEFRTKIEMWQIGARQESARIGGIGSCGRELCCSTWLSDFKTVNTNAARYQNIAINQSKLTGQCGRLKCCLNYELDLYVDELEKYPSNVDELYSKKGKASLVKIDIFRGVLYYAYEPERGRTLVLPLLPDYVRQIKAMNVKGEKPEEIVASDEHIESQKPPVNEYADVTGEIVLPENRKKKKKFRKKPFDKNQQRPQQ
ncbi:MAG: hypothetical protein IPO78_03330 [Saprospiraceae bacterium]|nr:hypothetical protein [Saprospiraceae bacterium]MBK9223105.1 hypothetical protein [Saprospiraceae bacterium]MBK9720635.1 hypothetical protein [Saprospiraceae bacterium]MBK9727624.1 hypothetical protein [Saprospiraceae bacterium]